ncbi:MAG: hypothetical protein JW931_02380 [Methanomicrobiaceae archaeon]|nr:hypothetical protein [Methanomicrobiaceae archaeon]
MKKICAFIILLILVFFAGCTGSPVDSSTTTPVPATQVVPEQTDIITPEMTQAPESPFPDAIPLGKNFVYGDEKDGRILTIYNAFLVPTYWFHSTAHGYDWEYPPAEGNQYLFLELKVKHNGTKTELGAPFPGSVNVYYDGRYYSFLEEREGAVYKVTDPNVGDDYVGGILNIHGTEDGFLIYEVPESLTLDEAYVQVGLGNVYGSPVWKLTV